MTYVTHLVGLYLLTVIKVAVRTHCHFTGNYWIVSMSWPQVLLSSSYQSMTFINSLNAKVAIIKKPVN